jgi:hypothetical protein
VSSVSPKYLTELAVGTRTPLMFMCTGSAFRRYVNCTILLGLQRHATWHTNHLSHLLDFALLSKAISSTNCASVMCGEVGKSNVNRI